MKRPMSRRGRMVLVAAAASSSTVFALPASAASSGSADIDIHGGDSLAQVVCGNVADAEALANQRGIRLQRTNCLATATGGSAQLENVEIIINRKARQASADARRLAGLARDSAVDTCKPLPGAPSNQRNICLARAAGGRVIISNGTFVMDNADGTRTVTRRQTVVLPGSGNGTAMADCVNVDSQVGDQRDDCNTEGTGGSLALQSVDVVDQTGTTRHDINVAIKGGAARTNTFCFNVEDPAGHIQQVNVCKSKGTGGDILLRNVQIHTTG